MKRTASRHLYSFAERQSGILYLERIDFKHTAMKIKLTLPEMGEGMIEATVGRWLKRVGDSVQEYDPVVEVETDKVTTEIVAERAGILSRIVAAEGETVAVGAVLAEFEPVGEPAAPPLLPTATSDTTPSASSASPPSSLGRISPVVARMARIHALDLSQISGTGRNGRITKRDVDAYLATSNHNQPTVEAEKVTPSIHSGPVRADSTVHSTLQPLSPMRRSIAEHMVRSVQTSPHATTVFEVDFANVVRHRKTHKATYAERGVRLTYTAYLMMAVAQALRQFPMVNSSWTDQGIALHRDIHIGMATAVDGGEGLIVPVIRHADGLNLIGMARAVNDLSQRARAKQLRPKEVQGGTFTLTNHGVSGSLFATPIINQPQAGILGVGAIVKRVVVIEDAGGDDLMAIRPMCYLSFSFDHRVLDGVSADSFAATVKQSLESWRHE